MTEGIEINEYGFILIHDEIYKSPVGRTYGKYLKRKVHEMVVDSYQRYSLNECHKFWKQKPKKKFWKFWK